MISVYTRLCWVHVCVESWVVKLWYKHSVFTPGCVGYMFRLSGKVLAQAFSEYTGWCWVYLWLIVSLEVTLGEKGSLLLVYFHVHTFVSSSSFSGEVVLFLG